MPKKERFASRLGDRKKVAKGRVVDEGVVLIGDGKLKVRLVLVLFIVTVPRGSVMTAR